MEFTRANFTDVVLSLAKKSNINIETLDGTQDGDSLTYLNL